MIWATLVASKKVAVSGAAATGRPDNPCYGQWTCRDIGFGSETCGNVIRFEAADPVLARARQPLAGHSGIPVPLVPEDQQATSFTLCATGVGSRA